jgi:radical SAM superfamily enzyme YgiQ (UPF0313 family)
LLFQHSSGLTEENNSRSSIAVFPNASFSMERPDILFIPPELNPVFSSGVSGFMPLGLLSLAACLKNNGITSRIYIPHIRLFSIKDYAAAAKDVLRQKPKIIGFSTWCNSYPASLLLAEQIKLIDNNIPVIFGGPQASILSIETLENFGFVDFILRGEAEYSILKLIKVLLNEGNISEYQDIEGLFYRNDKGRIVNPKPSTFISNLNELPVPAYEMVRPLKVLKLDTGRGCPFKCTYCSTSGFFSRKYRTKTVERIIGEMDLASEITGICNFSFTHDIFTLDKDFIAEFCSILINHCKNREKQYIWSCSARIDCISEDLLISMKEAGCRAIFLGIESGSPKIQHMIKKNLNVSTGFELADKCRNLGIDVHASFIIGFPYETRDDVEKSLQCILEFARRGSYTQISELSLLPGTPLFRDFGKDLKYDGIFSNFSHSLSSPVETEIIRKYPSVFSSFYYLPVNSMDRESMVILCRFVNLSGEFRNTIFLLRELIQNDLHGNTLLDIFFFGLDDIKEKQKSDYPLVSAWISLLKKYLQSKSDHEVPLYVYDVFIWEATQSLLKARFLRWQLLHPRKLKVKSRDIQPANYRKIIPTFLWDILSTSYNLSAIVPSKNGWVTEKLKIRKGLYHYLIVAVSEDSCNLIRLKTEDYKLLKELQEMSMDEFIIKESSFKAEDEWKKWIAKMIRIGVFEIDDNLIHE